MEHEVGREAAAVASDLLVESLGRYAVDGGEVEGALSYRLVLAGSREGRSLGGLYVAPLLNAGTAQRIVLGSSAGTAGSIALGLDVGFQSVSKKGLTLNVNTGWRRRVASWGTADVRDFPRLASPTGATEWWPGIGIGVGFAF